MRIVSKTLWASRGGSLRFFKVNRREPRVRFHSNLESMQEDWKKYGAVLDSWLDKRDGLSTYFCYGYQIRRLICTTNTIEGFNRQLRKVTKTKAVFPNDESLRKALYLCTRDITKKWRMPYPNWGETYGQFAIEFGERAKIA